jgi:hypothetical protein
MLALDFLRRGDRRAPLDDVEITKPIGSSPE